MATSSSETIQLIDGPSFSQDWYVKAKAAAQLSSMVYFIGNGFDWSYLDGDIKQHWKVNAGQNAKAAVAWMDDTW